MTGVPRIRSTSTGCGSADNSALFIAAAGATLATLGARGASAQEELRYDGGGPENATPRGYRVAQTPDLPLVFKSFVAEHGLGRGPGNLKGIGEAGMLGIAAAVANAIEDATGAVLTSLPFTPEKVLVALDAVEGTNA
jgi:CO/xanthine dehydrogenase Mo-binding subunit